MPCSKKEEKEERKTSIKLKRGPATITANFLPKDNDLYLRLRKRRADQPLVLNEKDSKGLPLILGRSPSRGDKGRRIVTVKKPPLNAIVVDI